MARALWSDADISSSPNDAGIRLGGLRPDGRAACVESTAVSGRECSTNKGISAHTALLFSPYWAMMSATE